MLEKINWSVVTKLGLMIMAAVLISQTLVVTIQRSSSIYLWQALLLFLPSVGLLAALLQWIDPRLKRWLGS